MAEFEDTSAALGRLEAALNRIAAQVGKPRPAAAPDLPESTSTAPATAAATDNAPRQEIVAKLDDLIGGLRNALGIEHHS